MSKIPWLATGDRFPPTDQALVEPNGLLAAGGDLSPERLLAAYGAGIFPWYEEGQPLLWWSPDPRAVLFPEKIKISRSLLKKLRRNDFTIKLNTNFPAVVHACAAPRAYTDGTWITDEMYEAYVTLHEEGHAHSIECYQGAELVGGLYGVSIGRMFFGESMFHRVTDASKVAFVYLARLMREQGSPVIDCQLENSHLMSLGCELMPREDFQYYLENFCDDSDAIDWTALSGELPGW